jgi:hypothetical protein
MAYRGVSSFSTWFPATAAEVVRQDWGIDVQGRGYARAD